MRALLGRMVEFATYDRETEMQLYLQGVLRELGFQTELREVLPGRPNLIAWRGRGGPLFVTHSDTHGPDGHPHPFAMRSDGDWLYGRGVMDAKGQIAALIDALSNSSRPCTVALVVDEEKDGQGSELLDLPADGAVVLEPTDLGLAIAQAGFIEAEFAVRGQAAHCSRPEAGRNAILAALALHEGIGQLGFMQAEHPLFPAPWLNLSALHGGSNPNVVPASCSMCLDVAILPGVDLEEAAVQMRQLAHAMGAEMRVRDQAPAFETAGDARVARHLADAIGQTMEPATGLSLESDTSVDAQRQPRWVGQRSWTDAENLVQQGIPTIVYGAGDLSLAHSEREAVRLSDLETMSRVLARFIDQWER